MKLTKVLLIFSFIVFSMLCFSGIRWLLNQPSDLLVILACLASILYVYVAFKTNVFTRNPFKQ